MRTKLLDELCSRILEVQCAHPVRVAIDGPDAAGKTTLANELVAPLSVLGRPVIRASIDGFHNPARIRHRRGPLSPEGYYYDSFDYQSLIASVLRPLGPNGSREYRVAHFDFRTDTPVSGQMLICAADAILLFDGVFLLRPELLSYWDYSIFVDAPFETTMKRAELRDVSLFGGVEEVRRRYQQRYIPGQELYFAECRPKTLANVVIENNDQTASH
jgi:uridine kinase